MLQRIAPKFTTGTQALAVPFADEETTSQGNQTTNNQTSLYTLALLVRVGLVAAIIVRALALWQW